MGQDQKILSVKDLNRYMKMRLESDQILQDVWIRGEISNFKHHSSGHMYFTLKDEASRLRCIMFSSHNARLGFFPKEGSRVIAQGSISIYERDGQYQLYITQMQPDGIGSLYLAFEQLKQKLQDEGLFAPERKRQIPRFPRTIGVVTSPTGAAIRDVLITLQRRFPSAPVLIYPALVQGPQAAPSISKAIQRMNELEEVDVLIVGRGGGSLEELWAFNEEAVARSIVQSAIPVISAVGHETDYTIADFVADLRAATPTAAAEMAVPHYLELKQQLHYNIQRLQAGLLQQLQRKKERLNRLNRTPFFLQPRKQFMAPAERLDRLTDQLEYRIKHRLNQSKDRFLRLNQKLAQFRPQEQVKLERIRLNNAAGQMLRTMKALQKEKAQSYHSLIKQLDALSPLKVMQRGYSLTYNSKQQLIKTLNQVQLGDLIQVRLTDGSLNCQVWSMEEGDKDGNQGA